MRVALNGWFWNRPETGSGQYIRRLTYAFSSLIPESEFFIFLPIDETESHPPNVHFVNVPTKQNALRKLWWEQLLIPQLAVKYQADVLHIPYWAPPLFCRIPSVVTIHDLIPLLLPEYHGGVLVRSYTSLVSATTPRATLILTDSQASQIDIERNLRIPAIKIKAIHLAVDDIYNNEPDSVDNAVLNELGIDPGYVLYLGGFDRRKNLSTIMAAFRLVKDACPDAVLVIAGKLPQNDTHFAPDPRNLASKAGLTESDVRFLGFVPERTKPALYRNARVFVYPSFYEGFGYPPLEALACGVPVVGSQISSLPEVIGDAGILLPPTDAPGIAGAVIHIISDDSFYTDLHISALQQAKLFSWQNTALKTFDAYREAVKIHQN